MRVCGYPLAGFNLARWGHRIPPILDVLSTVRESATIKLNAITLMIDMCIAAVNITSRLMLEYALFCVVSIICYV